MVIKIEVPKFKSHQQGIRVGKNRNTGKMTMFKKKGNATYEELILKQIIKQIPKHHKVFKTPICIGINYYIKIPTQINKVSLRAGERRELANLPAFGKPDMDNITKTILDRLEEAGVYADDKMICDMHLKRFFVNDIKSKSEYCHIEIKEVV